MPDAAPAFALHVCIRKSQALALLRGDGVASRGERAAQITIADAGDGIEESDGEGVPRASGMIAHKVGEEADATDDRLPCGFQMS